MDSVASSNPNATESNPYDSGFIKHDVDFDSQNLLDLSRSKMIDNHFDMSCLKDHTMQFKKKTANTNHTDHAEHDDDRECKTKLLEFDADFESGNIGSVHHYRGNEYDITIRGDSNNERHSVWFYFRVKGGVAGNKVTCHVHNYSKGKSLYSEGFTPLIRSKTKPIWTRLPSNHVSWFKCNRHKRNCFTISVVFDRSGDEYFFAYSFVYTYSYLQKFLGDIQKLNLSFVKRELLARTVRQRRLDCLRIEECVPNTPPIDERPVIVFSARVHPGETCSSYVIHGLIEFLLSENEAAVFLRQNLSILIIPMLNPDGVFMGNYRSTSLGYDLNRHWHHPDFEQHPTICALKFLLRQLDANNALDFYMDLHGHTNAMDAFMYCNQSLPAIPQQHTNEETTPTLVQYSLDNADKMGTHYERNDFTTIFPRLLDLHCNEYSFAKTKFCNNPKKMGSARRAMEAILSDIPVCYTFEASFWKSAQKSSVLHSPGHRERNLYTQETYRNIGRCMAQALCDIYKLSTSNRNLLNQYSFKASRLMKGDLRKKLQKLRKNNAKTMDTKPKADKENHDGSNKINVSMPSVPTI
eukprot:31613_1